MAPTLPGFQGLKRCIQYLDSNPHKSIFYVYYFYDGSYAIRTAQSGYQIKDYTTQLLTENGLFQAWLILFLEFQSTGKYIFDQMYPLTPIVDKLDICTRISGKIRQSGDT